ncbi:MAG: tRNA (adenosine(37)-N6)-threonylcarbamoyltransferase complex transferase subunit TsaD, partial [Chloroflexota bacterium]|nr:tRNA (adenosine(37)-N6)-threonylcarbamoyltransferase complex transferase subunit TsaD [Chloroflexota bacterium]
AKVADTFGERHPTVSWPDLSFCTDNAAMIAGLARWREPLTGGAAWSLDAYPNLTFGERHRR